MNNVFVISERFDKNTDLFLEWMDSFSIDAIRINFEDSLKYDISFFTEGSILKINNHQNNSFSLITKDSNVWHRRGHLPIRSNNYSKLFDDDIEKYLSNESDNLIKSLDVILKKNVKIHIGSWFHEKENQKLTNLFIARSIGFTIPKTIITNSKAELLMFYTESKPVISKAISKMPLFFKQEFTASNGTFLVTEEMIDKLSNKFESIILQQYIDKIYEVRIFVFADKIYPMAIFSKGENGAKVDYRNQSDENKCIPYILPNEIKNKVKSLMKLIDLDTGSVDLMVTQDDKYVFLEINPMGQFDWVSVNCNYNIEFEIANFFKNNL